MQLILKMDKDLLLLKVSGKPNSASLNYWPLNMVFRFSYFEESHHIQLQIKKAIWLQTEILQILYQTENFLKTLSHSQNSSKNGDPFIFLQYLANNFQIRKYIYIYIWFLGDGYLLGVRVIGLFFLRHFYCLVGKPYNLPLVICVFILLFT